MKSLFYYYLALLTWIIIIILFLSIILIPIWYVLKDDYDWWKHPFKEARKCIILN